MSSTQGGTDTLAPQTPPLEVGGRRFVVCQHTTLEQDMHIMSLLEQSQLSEISISNEGDVAATGQRILVQAYKTGVFFELLSAATTEEGIPWTPEGAKANAAIFSAVNDPATKAAVQSALIGVLMAFFLSAGLLSTTSRPSLSAATSQSEG